MRRLVLWFGVACFVCSFWWMCSSLPVLLMWFAQFGRNSKSESHFYCFQAAAAEKKTLCHLTQPIELTPCSLHFLHRAFHQPWLINGTKPLITSKCNFRRLSFEWSLHFCVESSTTRRWYLSRTKSEEKTEHEKEENEEKKTSVWRKNTEPIPMPFKLNDKIGAVISIIRQPSKQFDFICNEYVNPISKFHSKTKLTEFAQLCRFIE